MNYNEYAATKIMGWAEGILVTPSMYFAIDPAMAPGDGAAYRHSAEGLEDVTPSGLRFTRSYDGVVRKHGWHPDTDRNQLWLVMNHSLIFDTGWIARAVRSIHSNSNYPDDATHQHHYANQVMDRDKDTNWNELCKWAITLPSVALAAICKAHQAQEQP